MALHAEQLIQHIRRLVTGPPVDIASDAALLGRYLKDRDETAFAALVRQHGSMVLRACRRLLPNPQDAEDAFQATFLGLARKANTIQPPSALAAWLHGVARRLALKARTAAARRQLRETPTLDIDVPDPHPDPLADLSARDLLGVLDEEVERLPKVYRLPVVLCCLEGHSQEEAAQMLGWTAGSVKGRLERGRKRLHARLAQRGLTLAAGLAVLELSRALAADASGQLVAMTIRAAIPFAAGGGADGLSSRVSLLAEEGLRSLTMIKAKVALALLLVLGVVAAGVGAVALQSRETPQPRQTGPKQTPREGPARTDRHGDPLPDGAIARLGTLRWRHDGEAGSVAFSPDGKTVAATTERGIFLYEAATGRPLGRLPSLQVGGPLAFSPDGKHIVWQGGAEVHVWDLAKAEEVRRLPLSPQGPGGLSVLRFSPDGKRLAWGSSGPVLVWDVASGKQIHALGDPQKSAPDLAFSPDGKMLAVATQEPAVQLWDLEKGKLVHGIDAHKILGAGDTIRRFAMAVAFSPDGKIVASVGRERVVISDAATGKEVISWAKTRDWMFTLAFTPDGQTLIGGDEAATIYVWNVADGKERFVLGGGEIARSVALSPDGKTAVRGTSGTTLRLWDVTTGKPLFADGEGHTAKVHAVAFSPDGKLLATGGEHHHIHLWNPITGQHVRQFKGQSASTVSFSPDGSRLASVWYWNKPALIWDVAKGEEVLQLPREGAAETPAAAFAPDGKTVVSVDWTKPTANKSAGTARLHVWNAADGKHLREIKLEDLRPSCLAVAADGRLAAVGGFPMGLSLCDVERGQVVLPLRGHERQINSVAFSSDGKTLISGSTDRTARLWEVTTGREIHALMGHDRPVTAVAIAPNSRVAASAEGDRFPDQPVGPQRIRLWDMATGKELFHLEGHNSDVTSLAFSPDGKRLVSGQRNSTVLIWDLTNRRLPALPEKDLPLLLADLAEADTAKAHLAIWTLAASPDKAVSFLKEHLKPVAKADPKRVQQWLSDLDSDDFQTRDAASRELLPFGEQIEPMLRGILEGKPAKETRRRVETILAELAAPSRGERLQGLRAVQVLEKTGTAEALRLLQVLADGTAEARLTREAKEALGRMARLD